MGKNVILREALGVGSNFAFTEQEIADLRNSNMGITPYVILFTARSGSTFLTHEVANAKVLSTPNEWFSWLYAREDMTKHGGTPFDFVKRLIDSQRSELGVFGVETNRLMLELFEDLIPLQKLFPRKPRWFFLRRRNVVMQAISNYLADASQIFHSYQRGDGTDQKIKSVEYDGEKLKKYIKNFINEEIWLADRFAKMHVEPVNLYYEDVTHDPKSATKTISNVLGIWLPSDYLNQDIANPIKRMASEQNRAFEDRFRSEEDAFLEEMLDLRPAVLTPASSI